MTQKPFKIAFDASPLLVNRTGVANYIEHLVCALAAEYPDVTFVGFYYNFLHRRSAAHMPSAPNIQYKQSALIPSKIVYQLRRWGIEIPLEFLTKSRSDFVLFGNFLGYPSMFHTPAAPVVHDLTYLDLPEYVSAKNRSDLTRFVPRQIHRSDFVITVSEFSKQKIAETYLVNPDNIIVTPIPPAPPAPVHKNVGAEILQSLDITKPYILFVGTIEPRKNVLNLIDAFLRLPEQVRTRYQLVIAGRIGWNCTTETAKLTALNADQASGVTYVGFVDDDTRAALYSQATLFASASHYEGFGMPVLEAMSYGIPCAISDIPVFREVAENSAHYFDQTNTDAISDTLHTLLESQNTLAALGKQGRQQAAKYQWKDIARQVMTRIRQSVAEKEKLVHRSSSP